MDLSLILKAIFLGIIEGLTEFIPVSSTAHLLILSHLIEFDSVRNNVFEIAIQIGAILAICMVYRQKICETIIHPNSPKSRKFIINLFLAFLPSVFLGVLLHDPIKNYFFNNLSIALALLIGGIIMIIIDYQKRHFKITDVDHINYRLALIIGFCQCLAMIPGVSRSGATILGALLVGINRKSATEFSFFLAIPTISSACLYDILKNLDSLTITDFELILIGAISSFISAILVIKWFIKFVSKNSFVGFGIYRIVLGALLLVFLI